MTEARLITLDPAHFHAALVQKEMYSGVAKQVHVYAPLGADLAAHLNRIAGFNTRSDNPATWELEVHAGGDFLHRLVAERPGNVVVLSGRNRKKIDYILAAVAAGLHVLADKPWIIRGADLPKLETALTTARRNNLVAYDIMTERHEITSILQRDLVNEGEIFGDLLAGTPAEPGIHMESVHYLMKTVAGVPLRRPAWFFDIHQQGEGLTDVGTHLVDLVPWMAFPERAIDRKRDIQVLAGRRWASVVSKPEFQKITGESEFPDNLKQDLQEDGLHYFCNNSVTYTIRGIHTKLDVLWKVKAAAGAGDSHRARFRGDRAAVEIRQGKNEGYRPELYVVPRHKPGKADVHGALSKKVAALRSRFPGIGVEDRGKEWRVVIPDAYRAGHEAHFAQVTQQFLGYLKDPASLPAWEEPIMLAKYYVTTMGVEKARGVT